MAVAADEADLKRIIYLAELRTETDSQRRRHLQTGDEVAKPSKV